MRNNIQSTTMFSIMLLAIMLTFSSFSLMIFTSTAAISGNIEAREALTISNAHVRAMPPGLDVTAAYMTIHNSSDNAITLIKLQSPIAKAIAMHENISRNGVTHMQAITNISIPAHGKISFSSGGKHIMLMGIDNILKAGQQVQLTLILLISQDQNATEKYVQTTKTINIAVHDMRQ